MSLIYRAMWEDDRTGVADVADGAFVDWVASKYPHLDIVDRDRPLTDERVVPVAAERHRMVHDGIDVLEATLVEDRPGERWMTRLRSLQEHDAGGWLWIDVERVADDAYRRASVVAPRLARSLLESADGLSSPSCGPAPMSTRARVPPPNAVTSSIIGLLTDEERTTPLVVFSHRTGEAPAVTVERANSCARILAGVATVFALSPTSQSVFEQAIGRELSVWGGSARLYLPGELTPRRHRYIPHDVLQRSVRTAGERFAQMLSASIAARRAPPIYERVRRPLHTGTSSSYDDLLEVAEAEVAARDEEIATLRVDLERERDDRIDAIGEIETLQQRNEELRRVVLALQRGSRDTETATDELWAVPTEVSSLQEVVALTVEHLRGVALHEDAARDLEELDQAIEAVAWARTAWVGMRALNAYQGEAADFNGGFWEWCQHTGNVDRWPATSKKLAMSESETVMNNEKLSRCRLLPVDVRVDPSGRVLMQSHLKIAEGGGQLAPRIYFLDDTKGVTGLVHVGFFGPHRHMPNTKTN